MAALTGLPTRWAAQIADQVATADDAIWVANINSATQTVFSGTTTALDRAADAARTPERSTTSGSTCRWRPIAPKQAGTAAHLKTHFAGLPR